MTELLALAQKLSGIGFGTMLVLILMGSYFHKWMWTRDHSERIADFEKRLAKADELAQKWESIAIKATGLATHGVGLAEQRSKHE